MTLRFWTCLVLGALACRRGSEPDMPADWTREPSPGFSDADLAAYQAGTSAAINALRTAAAAADGTQPRMVDSVAAAASGRSIDEFERLRTLVENWLVNAELAGDSRLAARGPLLDSLRTELMVMRLRAEVKGN